MPDFTVGDLRLIDQGAGNNPAVQVRVGNAGPVDAHEPPYIGVYRGDPAAGGVLLAETRLDTLRPNRFQIVNLGEVDTAGSGELFAIVDQRSRARECRENNNRRRVPFLATNGRGDLQVATDHLVYAPGATATLTATVANRALAAGYTVEWSIRNSQGAVTAEPARSPSPWSRPERRPRWRCRGRPKACSPATKANARLRNAQGSVIDTATAAFAITGDASGPAGTRWFSAHRA